MPGKYGGHTRILKKWEKEEGKHPSPPWRNKGKRRKKTRMKAHRKGEPPKFKAHN